MTTRSQLFAIWANNNGGRWARVEIAASEARTEDEIEDGLLAQLGLRQ